MINFIMKIPHMLQHWLSMKWISDKEYIFFKYLVILTNYTVLRTHR